MPEASDVRHWSLAGVSVVTFDATSRSLEAQRGSRDATVGTSGPHFVSRAPVRFGNTQVGPSVLERVTGNSWCGWRTSMSKRDDIVDGAEAYGGDGTIRKYGLIYTSECGWIDLGHANPEGKPFELASPFPRRRPSPSGIPSEPSARRRTRN
jgi:hypothetical protein